MEVDLKPSHLAAFLVTIGLMSGFCPQPAGAESIARFLIDKGVTKKSGFLTAYWEAKTNKVYLEVPDSAVEDILYQATLASGVGHVPLYLDRGSIGPTRLVALRRFGSKALMIERNTRHFTPSAKPGSVEDTMLSFAGSVIAAFDVVAGAPDQDGTKYLLDATSLFLQDDVDVTGQIREAGQGKYQLDAKLGTIDGNSLKVSDSAIEVKSLLAFTTSEPPPPKDTLETLVQNRNSILLSEQHVLAKLPPQEGASYRPRAFDQRIGYFDLTFYDPSSPPLQSPKRSFIKRHHLAKKNPNEAVSEPVRPITFHIDPSVPAELRPLVKEAIGWWNTAFEAAGFRNAIEVVDLPAGANPLSMGMHSILWTQRSTRGYSYGQLIADPRTGEIIQSTVRLDAMRLRADRLLFDAITTPYGDRPNLSARDEALRQRFKLLVAHEVGHVLGVRHQYASSAEADTSVMDYPFPRIALSQDGAPILRDVFPQGLGAWDKLTIQYGYKQFSPQAEASELRKLAEELDRNGLYWQTDGDTDDANPLAQRWDQGRDPVAELRAIMTLRQNVLQRFSKAAISSDEPLATLQDAIVPVYLLHQFAMKPVAAMMGGFEYQYALRDQAAPVAVASEKQRQALAALLTTLDPEALNLPDHILQIMAPRPVSYPATAESITGATGVIFDAVRPVEVAAWMTMQEVLKPGRAARLAQAAARDSQAPGLTEVLTATVERTWKQSPKDGHAGLAQRTIATVVVQSILAAIARSESSSAVKAACWLVLDDLEEWMKTHPPAGGWRETYAMVSHSIADLKRDPSKFVVPPYTKPQLEPMGVALIQ
jgi:hypothetical protein